MMIRTAAQRRCRHRLLCRLPTTNHNNNKKKNGVILSSILPVCTTGTTPPRSGTCNEDHSQHQHRMYHSSQQQRRNNNNNNNNNNPNDQQQVQDPNKNNNKEEVLPPPVITNNHHRGTTNNLQLFDSLTETIQTLSKSSSSSSSNLSSSPSLSPKPPRGLAWYTCGPTTYAPAHMGHARTYVCLDIMRRILESQYHETFSSSSSSISSSNSPPPPLFVMNITDVDDKILAAAAAAAAAKVAENNAETTTTTDNHHHHHLNPALSLARDYETEFWNDLKALNCLQPHVVTRVSEYVESDIVPYIQQLVDFDMAYEIINDGIYFNVQAYNQKLYPLTKYGKLAPSSAAMIESSSSSSSSSFGGTPFFETTSSRTKRRGGVDSNNTATIQEQEEGNSKTTTTKKLDSRDFVLWKYRKVDTEDLFWSSPWGDGRPGWHIECSAMIEAIQKQFSKSHQFVVHAGGIDLKFPHHTNEIAQAEAYHYQPSTNHNQSNTGNDGRRQEEKNEWIPHWVHTGHLHIDGLKMSKSLKNFISIQDFLNMTYDDNDNNDQDGSRGKGGGSAASALLHSLESPADDFRLWCLGLSGSYRGPATFSKNSISEARSIRQKLVRFLMESEDWISQVNSISSSSSSSSSTASSSKKWQEKDYQLFDEVNEAYGTARAALSNDLDGSTFLKEVIRITELGRAHISYQTSSSSSSSSSSALGPVEPIQSTLTTIRKLLSLVGFSERTTHVGLGYSNTTTSTSSTTNSKFDDGDNSVLVDELVQFRSAVRSLALQDAQNKTASGNMKDILKLCDNLRDITLPEMGIELLDSKVQVQGDDKGTGGSDEKQASTTREWRYCLPKYSKNTKEEEEEVVTDYSNNNPSVGTTTEIPSVSVSVEDYFRVGQYKDKFSQFDEDGIPITNADGSAVSKRLLKKLLKKREAYQKKRLDRESFK